MADANVDAGADEVVDAGVAASVAAVFGAESDPVIESITIDANAGEAELFERVSRKAPCEVRRQRLDVGDVLITSKFGKLIIERKHVPDLISSIRDGRYKEQRSRQLLQVSQDEGRTAVIWVIEGPLIGWHTQHHPTGFPNSQMEAAVISTAVRDGIPVLRVPDAEGMAEVTLYLQKRLAAGELDGASAAQRRAAEGYAGVMSVKKAKNLDGDTVWRTMLATTPGVSMAKAGAISERFKTPAALVDMIRASASSKAAVKQLAAIDCGSRKLGPAVATKIVEVFRAS